MKVAGSAPLGKVTVQTLTTALVALLVYLLQRVFGVELPGDVQAAVSVLIGSVLGLIAAYYTPIRQGEIRVTPEYLED